MQRTASTSGDLSGQTTLEQLTGETPEISEYLDFTFYDWCWYKDNAGLGETKLGRWLGVSHRIGSLMSYMGTYPERKRHLTYNRLTSQ